AREAREDRWLGEHAPALVAGKTHFFEAARTGLEPVERGEVGIHIGLIRAVEIREVAIAEEIEREMLELGDHRRGEFAIEAGIEVRILLARIERLDACPFTNEAANSADGAGMFKHALGFGFENVILQDGAVFNLLPERFIRDGRPEE